MRAGSMPDQQLDAVIRAWMLFHTTRRAEALVERGVSEGVFTAPYPREAAPAIFNRGCSIASWHRPGGELTPEETAGRYAVLALSTVGGKATGQITAQTYETPMDGGCALGNSPGVHLPAAPYPIAK